MKKLFTFLTLFLVSSGLWAQTIASLPYSEDFTVCGSDWTAASVASTKDWTCGSGYQSINGYGGDVASDDYLISPVINLDNFSNEVLSFDSWTRYSDATYPPIELLYTTNYTGDPSTTTWNTLSATWSAENSQTWTGSGNIDISGISGTTVRFAFHYTSTGTGGGTSSVWQIDNISISEISDLPPSITNVQRDKKVPLESEDLVVSATVTDDNSLSTVNLIYTKNGGSQNTIAMTNTSGDEYSATIPNSVYVNTDLIEYWVSATDNAAQNTEGTHYKFVAGNISILVAKTSDVNGVLLLADAYCRVTGIATVASGVFSTSSLDVYMQDGTGGVNIYLGGGSGISITAGNSYTVVGAIAQYNGKAEIIPDAAGDVTDNGADVMPDPTVKTLAEFLASPETYEGMLVGVQHMNYSSGTWAANQNLVFTDDGGTTTLTFRLDGDTDLDENAEPAWPKDVVGLFLQYDSSSPYTSGYQIQPRAFTDIQNDGALPVELTSFTAIANENEVNLKWKTATEADNYGFEVQRFRQTDGGRAVTSEQSPVWQKIGFVEGAGNSNSPKEYSYTDASVVSGKYTYRLKQVDIDGQCQYSNEVEAEIAAPAKYTLAQNYPNPFNPTTVISYQIPENGMVELTVYDVLGNEVTNLVNETQEAGKYQVTFNASNLASGIYFYKLSSGNFTSIKKLMLLK